MRELTCSIDINIDSICVGPCVAGIHKRASVPNYVSQRVPTAPKCADVASRENMGLIRSAHKSHSYQHDTSVSDRKEMSHGAAFLIL